MHIVPRCALTLEVLFALLLVAIPARGQTETEPTSSREPETHKTVAAGVAHGPNGEQKGHIHLTLFASDNSLLPGVRVEFLGQPEHASTDSKGGAQLSALPGFHTLRLILTDDRTFTIADIGVAPGTVTEVIASIGHDGTLDADIMAPNSELLSNAPANHPSLQANAQPAVPGTLFGRVIAAEDKRAVAGAALFVAGQQIDATTNALGQFEIRLPPGRHTLSVIHAQYSTQTISDLLIESKTRVESLIELSPVAIELQDFTVTAPHIAGGVASMMDERRNSAAMSDAIGAEDIAKLPASNAAQAAQRVVGATIVGGRFVYVRGLGERYSNALLNGVPLPSPEPDRATVPLDLFPSQILQQLDIRKTFTPDVPGDFAGASVRIETKSVPEEQTFSLSLGTSFNTESTFKKSWGQRTSTTDFLGFDDGMRSLPTGVTNKYAIQRAYKRPDGNRVSKTERLEAAKLFDSPLYPTRKTNWPNGSGNVTYGNRWDLGKNAQLGFTSSLIYRRNFKFRNEILRNYQSAEDEDNGLQLLQNYNSETTTDAVRWGAFASTGLTLGEDNKITLLGMHSQLADGTTRILGGSNTFKNGDVRTVRMDFISRGLTFGQLQGTHTLPLLNHAQIKWIGSLARAKRSEDDTRDTVFQAGLDEGSPYRFIADNGSGRHYYADLSENARSLGLDWRQPLTEDPLTLSVKAGTLVTTKHRTFGARNFTTEVESGTSASCGTSFDPAACTRQVFAPGTLGSAFSINETTNARQDAYDASLNVYAGYLMADIALGEEWKALGGLRFEQTDQVITPTNQFTEEAVTDKVSRINQIDTLPALNLVYSPTDKFNVRVAGSKTVARPQLRELAEIAYVDYYGGPTITGNPALKLTRIYNADVRLEYFSSPREVLALSVFGKRFIDPIEQLQSPSSEGFALTYDNTAGATLYGVEVEIRQGLGVLSKALAPFSVTASLMVAKSEIEIEETKNAGFLTNTERPMMQAAPWVTNLALDYEDTDSGLQLRILYNASGKKLNAVGTFYLADGYEHTRHVLDLTASQTVGDHFKLKASITNLLDAPYVTTIGKSERPDNVVSKYRSGATVSLGISYQD